MNTETAKAIVCKVAHLAELAATFNATYGANYRMTEDSPREAWALYREIMAVQAHIAGLLDGEALRTCYSRYGEWWKRMDVMDSALVNEIASEGFSLINRCAYLDVHDSSRWTHSDLVLQRSIAGLLHPATRQVELANAEAVRKAM
ncbi:MAG: hypothetical protein MUE40_20540 [Anaerolineae bacterium]|nr:hypothetical protein [Anaerolineae bacterium]